MLEINCQGFETIVELVIVVIESSGQKLILGVTLDHRELFPLTLE